MQTKSKKTTFANILAIIGLVGIIVFTYMGHSFLSGGEMAWDITIAAIITLATVGLLWLMVKAKAAQNNLSSWKIVEYATLTAYIALAGCGAYFGGFLHFFNVNADREKVQQCAMADLQKINTLFETYSDFEDRAITQTCTGLRSAVTVGSQRNDDVNSYLQREHINADKASVDTYERTLRTKLLGNDYDIYYNNFKSRRREVENTVKNWAFIHVPAMAKTTEELASSAESELKERIKSKPLPTVSQADGSGIFTLGAEQQCNIAIEGGINSLQFKAAVMQQHPLSIIGIVALLLLHLLILFSYFVTSRTDFVHVGKDKVNDGGVRL